MQWKKAEEVMVFLTKEEVDVITKVVCNALIERPVRITDRDKEVLQGLHFSSVSMEAFSHESSCGDCKNFDSYDY